MSKKKMCPVNGMAAVNGLKTPKIETTFSFNTVYFSKCINLFRDALQVLVIPQSLVKALVISSHKYNS